MRAVETETGSRVFADFRASSEARAAGLRGFSGGSRPREAARGARARTHERVETDPISGFFQRSQAERGSERSPAITVHTLLQKNVMLETTGRWWIAARGKSH